MPTDSETPGTTAATVTLRATTPVGLVFHLPPDSVLTLGRAPDADLVVDAALVSRAHCRFTHAEGRLSVEDLGSTNGTFVNGTLVSGTAPLAAGDRVQVGRVELRVEGIADRT